MVMFPGEKVRLTRYIKQIEAMSLTFRSAPEEADAEAAGVVLGPQGWLLYFLFVH